MSFLFLIGSDQREHYLSKYLDLRNNYDYLNVKLGISAISSEYITFDYFEYFVLNGPLKTENKIRQIVENFSIKFIVFPNLFYELSNIFLNELSKKNIRLIMVGFDDSNRFDSYIKCFLGEIDAIVTHESINSKVYYKNFENVSFFPLYPSKILTKKILEKVPKINKLKKQVVFVGAKIPDRGNFFEAIKKAKLPVAFYGDNWSNPRINQKEMLCLYRDSIISLNFSKNASQKNPSKQLKSRAFEITLAGGFLLTEYDSELLDYFNLGTEIDMFSSEEELISKIKFYIDNPKKRDQMRVKAQKKALEIYNFEVSWENYINNKLLNSDTKPRSYHFKLSNKFLFNYLIWNFSYIYGRIINFEFRKSTSHFIWFLSNIIWNLKKNRFSLKNLSFQIIFITKRILFKILKNILKKITNKFP